MLTSIQGELGSNRVDRGVHSFESTTAYGTPVEYGLSEQSEQYNSRSPEMVEILRTINTEEGLLACTGGIAILIMDYILGVRGSILQPSCAQTHVNLIGHPGCS